MPHKLGDYADSNSSSRVSSSDRIHVADVPDPSRRSGPKAVVVHNGGGPSYDDKRPASWDKSRWK
ncbi:hypothetical protein UA08_00121 [Talaromyces atroroseus]|uniref:Uncharacterized protein n=1 Tax=Talaromyces atroroseus TaxID=1441469 RepID=A0A225AQU2_TALAT|nr:hypothetical protein UA08_00121 [Talaromyces atroroseus]OKL63991.1 hypothetical protein UA08_00121 [Talaromyces atroroseus]